MLHLIVVLLNMAGGDVWWDVIFLSPEMVNESWVWSSIEGGDGFNVCTSDSGRACMDIKSMFVYDTIRGQT